MQRMKFLRNEAKQGFHLGNVLDDDTAGNCARPHGCQQLIKVIGQCLKAYNGGKMISAVKFGQTAAQTGQKSTPKTTGEGQDSPKTPYFKSKTARTTAITTGFSFKRVYNGFYFIRN